MHFSTFQSQFAGLPVDLEIVGGGGRAARRRQQRLEQKALGRRVEIVALVELGGAMRNGHSVRFSMADEYALHNVGGAKLWIK